MMKKVNEAVTHAEKRGRRSLSISSLSTSFSFFLFSSSFSSSFPEGRRWRKSYYNIESRLIWERHLHRIRRTLFFKSEWVFGGGGCKIGLLQRRVCIVTIHTLYFDILYVTTLKLLRQKLRLNYQWKKYLTSISQHDTVTNLYHLS